jgi:hypothetical protein
MYVTPKNPTQMSLRDLYINGFKIQMWKNLLCHTLGLTFLPE